MINFEVEADELVRKAFDLIAHVKQPQARALAGSHQKIRNIRDLLAGNDKKYL